MILPEPGTSNLATCATPEIPDHHHVCLNNPHCSFPTKLHHNKKDKLIGNLEAQLRLTNRVPTNVMARIPEHYRSKRHRIHHQSLRKSKPNQNLIDDAPIRAFPSVANCSSCEAEILDRNHNCRRQQ
jgi:hypothetical protein